MFHLLAAAQTQPNSNGDLGTVLQFLELFAVAGGFSAAISAVRSWWKTRAQDQVVRATVLPKADGTGGIVNDLGTVKSDVGELRTDVSGIKGQVYQLAADMKTLKPNGGDTNNLGDLVFNLNKNVEALLDSQGIQRKAP